MIPVYIPSLLISKCRILQPIKVFHMLVGMDDLYLDIKREGIYTGILQPG
jgi:hypothetical protein